eukprot:12692288-Alexandrium_andersonii.AAC.1
MLPRAGGGVAGAERCDGQVPQPQRVHARRQWQPGPDHRGRLALEAQAEAAGGRPRRGGGQQGGRLPQSRTRA